MPTPTAKAALLRLKLQENAPIDGTAPIECRPSKRCSLPKKRSQLRDGILVVTLRLRARRGITTKVPICLIAWRH